jgi:hypothetical protein
MLTLVRHALARALMLACAAAILSTPAMAQYGFTAPSGPAVAPCVPFSTFPLSVNLGTALDGRDGETSRCGFGKVQTAINALSNMRAQPNGIATLDANGLVPLSQVPATVSLTTAVPGDFTVAGALNVGTGASGPVDGASVKGRTLAARAADILNARDFGAIADGQRHPLSQRYSTLAAAQTVCPKAVALTDEIDWCAIQTALDSNRPVSLPDGYYVVNRTIAWSTSGIGLIGTSQNSTQIRRYGDYGPTVSVGGTTGAAYGDFIRDVAFYDFGNAFSEMMTQAKSPFHIVADNTIAFTINSVLIANATNPSAGGGILILGGIDELITNTSVALQNGPSAGKIGIRIGKSTFANGGGGGKAGIVNCNIEGGIVSGTTLNSNMDYGLQIESGDGLWVSDLHIQGTALADLHLTTTNGVQFSNLYFTNTMLDITNGNGLLADGTGLIDTFQFSGRISAAGIGGLGKSGVLWYAPGVAATISGDIDGWSGDCFTLSAPNMVGMSLRPNRVRNCNGSNNGARAYNLVAGQRISMSGGILGGDPYTAIGVDVGAGMSGFTASGTTLINSAGGLIPYVFRSGANLISVSGGSAAQVASPISNQTNAGALVLVQGVLGQASISQP